jgi:hypothetical protein
VRRHSPASPQAGGEVACRSYVRKHAGPC